MSAVQVSNTPCSHCKEMNLILHYEAGDIICTSCGVVNCSRIIDESDEVHHYQNDQESNKIKESRSSGMTELFDTMYTEFMTSSIELKNSLERSQRKTINSKDLKILRYLDTIDDTCAKINLSKAIQNSTIEIFSRAIREDVVTIKPSLVNSIIAACIYIACRKEGYPRTFDEISFYTSIPSIIIGQYHSSIATSLKLEMGRVKPEALVNRYGSALRLGNHEIIHNAELICQQIASNHILESIRPQAITATAILISCLLLKYYVELEKLARKSFITVALLKSTYRQLYEVRLAVIPSCLLSLTAEKGLPESITGQDIIHQYCNQSKNNESVSLRTTKMKYQLESSTKSLSTVGKKQILQVDREVQQESTLHRPLIEDKPMKRRKI